MKQLLFILFMLASYEMFGQVECLDEPICVVQFNAGWNSANSVDWCEGLSDCSYETVDIGADPSLATKYKIVVVPTIVIFKDGEEQERFQANIMMEMEHTQKDVQGKIDEIIMSDF